MEDFLPIIIFIFIMIISVVRNIAKTAKKVEGGKQTKGAFGEVFPQMEILQPEIPESPKQERQTKRVEIAKQEDTPIGNTLETPSNDKRGYKVALSVKSDAKKAFIYSEIFNKKYN